MQKKAVFLFLISSCSSLTTGSPEPGQAEIITQQEMLPESLFYEIAEKGADYIFSSIPETDGIRDTIVENIYQTIYAGKNLNTLRIKSDNEEIAGFYTQCAVLEGSLETGKFLFLKTDNNYSGMDRVMMIENYIQLYLSVFLLNNTVTGSRSFLAAIEHYSAEADADAGVYGGFGGDEDSADFFFEEMAYRSMKRKASAAGKDAYALLSAAAAKMDYIEKLLRMQQSLKNIP